MIKVLPLLLLYILLPFPTRAVPDLDNCKDLSDCWDCVGQYPTCVWCLATGFCVRNDNQTCKFTPRSNCCNTFTSCADCIENEQCGWCDKVGCLPGDHKHPTNNISCLPHNWFYSSCRSSITQNHLVLLIATLCGGAIIIVIGAISAVYIRKRRIKADYNNKLIDFYKTTKGLELCRHCYKERALFQCFDCNKLLCKNCSDRLHLRRRRHMFHNFFRSGGYIAIDDHHIESFETPDVTQLNDGYTTLAPLIEKMKNKQ